MNSKPVVYRQREWQLQMLAKGRCINCGKENDTKTQRCAMCREAYNAYHRQHHGHREWTPGSVGRPPKTNN